MQRTGVCSLILEGEEVDEVRKGWREVRYKFAREGIVSPIGYLFEKGSIKWTSEPIPVVITAAVSSSLIGKALDIRRDDDGWLSADIEWSSSDETLIESINRENFLTIFGNKLEMVDDPNIPSVKRIKTITLRELFLTDDLDVWGVK